VKCSCGLVSPIRGDVDNWAAVLFVRLEVRQLLAVESKDRGYSLNRKAASLDKYIVRKGSTS